MKISMVVAAALNEAIGKNNQLLWHLPEDLKFFKRTTMGFPIVMGRNTFESVGKPLPGRRNVIISRNLALKIEGCEVVHSAEEALSLLKDVPEIMIVGGAEVYRMFLPLADRIFMTRVETSPDADTFFPVLPPDQWKMISQEQHPADERHMFPFRFETWTRTDLPSFR
jgi:dihydrofolate reductase